MPPALPLRASLLGAAVVGVALPLATTLLVATVATGDVGFVAGVLGPSLLPAVFGLAYRMADDPDPESRYEVAACMGLGMGFGSAAISAYTWTASATMAWLAPGIALLMAGATQATRSVDHRPAALLAVVVGWAVGIAWSLTAVLRAWPPA